MYDIDKGCHEMSLNSTGEESLLLSHKKNSSRQNRDQTLPGVSEQEFPTIEETVLSFKDETTPNERTLLIENIPVNVFRSFIFEQILKAMIVLYLAVGFVAAAVFFCRQIVVKPYAANLTWKWVGILNGCLSLFVVVLVIWYKLLLHGHSYYFKRIQPENPVFFYTVISITAAISWIYFLMMTLRNIQYWKDCAVISDLIQPIAQMFFIMTGVTATSDLINCRVTPEATKKFYLIYKAASMLLFFNSINCLVFDLFEAESNYLQNFLAGNSTDIFCYKADTRDKFVKLIKDVGPFLQVFSSIFCISTIAILLKPIRQFCNSIRNFEQEARILQSFIINESLPHIHNPQYSSISVTLAVLACILSIIGIPLDLMAKNEVIIYKTKIQIIFNAIPIFLYIVSLALSIFLFKILYDNFAINKENTSSKNDFIVVWVSLFGQLVSCLKWIVNSSQFIHAYHNGLIFESFDIQVHIVCITLFSVSMIQGLVQTMVLDFIINLKTNSFISAKSFQQISYAVLILISTNLGFFFNDWYLLSGSSSFTCFDDSFNIILFDLLRTVSDPFSLIFRGYCVLFLLRFLLKIKCN